MRLPILAAVFFSLGLNAASFADDKQSEIDKRAFLRARKAAMVKTWDVAIAILEKIDIDKIEDDDVIEYVDFSLRCAKVADQLGIERRSDPKSPTDVIAKIDWGKIVATLIEKVVDEGPGKVAKLLADARKVQKQVPHYLELDKKLLKRYSKGPIPS
jgi:hypothetical protein